jgi:hypothetical protein
MKRWLVVFVTTFALSIALLCAGMVSFSAASHSEIKRGKSQGDERMKVRVEPWGPTQEMLDEAAARLSTQERVRRQLKGAKSRLVSFEVIPEDEKSNSDLVPPSRYRGTFYDYTNNVTVVAESSFDRQDAVEISTSTMQPQPSKEELNEALDIIKTDPKLGPALVSERLQFYPPMPPLYLGAKSKVGRVERAVNVGLLAKDPNDKTLERANEIVAVNLSQRTVIRFPDGAPPAAKAGPTAVCGPSPGGSSTGRGIAGQYQFVISDVDGTELWSFLAVRPSASSGVDGSGIELAQVKYKGKLLLKRANVPILNVNYDGNTCGPFRDWQYAESQFDADPTGGTNVTSGVRSCTIPATTQLETSVDTGNHQGIAFYTKEDETILVSEMSAGWYRYISEWRFGMDGTLKPRFGMGATSNSCTCNGHVHRAYWRLDFDIDGVANRVSNGFKLLRPAPIVQPLATEGKFYRNKKSFWIVKNNQTGSAYQIVANDNDGTAVSESYGKGDFWLLKYDKNELDDRNTRTDTSAGLDAFVNNQATVDTDIVVWYGIHINHNRVGGHIMGHPFALSGEMVAGPDLVPLSW